MQEGRKLFSGGIDLLLHDDDDCNLFPIWHQNAREWRYFSFSGRIPRIRISSTPTVSEKSDNFVVRFSGCNGGRSPFLRHTGAIKNSHGESNLRGSGHKQTSFGEFDSVALGERYVRGRLQSAELNMMRNV